MSPAKLVRCTVAIALGLAPAAFALAQSGQIPLAPTAIPQFVQRMPTLAVQPVPGNTIQTTVAGTAPLEMHMCEFPSSVLPPGTLAPGVQTGTWTWGYFEGPACPAGPRDTYIGPVVVATRGVPTEVKYVNDLGSAATTNVLAYKFSTDQTLHWADPLGGEANRCMMDVEMNGPPAFGSACAANYAGPIPAVPHLHGGEVPPAIDGSPDSWFTSDGAYRGHKYYTRNATDPGNTAVYVYPNSQEAGPLWFHDHTLGATRLNVYAGLAGAYFLVDPAQPLPANLHPIPEVVPLVIQDRSFDTNGQLFFQADSNGGILWTPNAEHPYWSPEFVGDVIVVNGKAWPFFEVQPKRYRFLVLNGSNARTYELFLQDQVTGAPGPVMWVIGNDGGYLDSPQAIDPALGQKLVVMPGERYEVIVDFSRFPGTNILVRNTGRTPYPKGAAPQGATLGRIVQFRVGPATGGVDGSYDPAAGGAIRPALPRLANPLTGTPNVVPSLTRQLTLNEVMMMPATVTSPVTGALTAYPGGPLEVLVNNTKWSGVKHMAPPRADFTPIAVNGITTWFSELPKEGAVELWEIVNLTADAHPIHLHLVQFQVLNRQGFNVSRYGGVYAASFPAVPGVMGCTGGVFCPGYGPPLAYGPSAASGGKYGGNPDVTRFLQGTSRPPAAQETGWKDTVLALPGTVTRLLVRWAPTDTPIGTTGFFPFDPNMNGQYNYVWHCHIIDHEDNEMMRPTSVVPLAGATRTFQQGTHF